MKLNDSICKHNKGDFNMKLKKLLSAVIATALLAASMAVPAFASSTVSSVKINVSVDFQAGDRLPDIDYAYSGDGSGGGTYVWVNSDKYEVTDATWVTSTKHDIAVGEEPKMKVKLETTSSDYKFSGTYRSSNVHVSGGTFVSASKSSSTLTVTLKVKAIKGTYDAPSDAYWKDSNSNSKSSLGKAKWSYDTYRNDDDEDDEDGAGTSGYYDIYLYKGSTVVHKVEEYKGTSYNFYPYMTKKGTYKFKVRSVPHTSSEKKYGKHSEWTESDEQYIAEEDVSDGSGQTNNNGGGSSTPGNVGWVQSNTVWYYKYPDGTYQKNSWLKVNDKWYLFDNEGKMLTGWQTKNGYSYFLENSGEMRVGWIQNNGNWYYLKPENEDYQGAAQKGWIHADGNTYYADNTGALLSGWQKVDGNWHYFYPNNFTQAVNTTIDTFYIGADGIWRK